MASGESKTFVAANERVLILLLCVAAALRVFIFSAAFPFFSNIDEDLHFDLITQYSHAQVPRSFDRLKEETLNWIVPYASPEFLSPPEQFPDGKFPAPLWKQPWSKVEPEIAATRAAWSSEINFESSQPPLYYALAGLWWWIGKQIGLVGIESLYWIRFLNAALMAIMVWLGYVAARTIAPERLDLRHRRAATTGFHSAECVLRNEQRCAVAAVFRRAVPLRFAMVANGRAELIAWSSHRRGDCVHVPDQIVELAADRHCGRSHPCQAWRNCSTKSSCRLNRACCTPFVRRRPNWQLDGLAETAVWRCHRINGENRVPGLDAEAVR